MTLRRLRRERSGSLSVEFALIAPVLVMAVLSTADVGLAVHEAFEIEQTLRNGAEAALRDPGKPRVDAVLAAIDGAGGTSWTVERYCACPETTGLRTVCSTTCTGDQPTAIFYEISGARSYTGILLPARNLVRTASVQVR